MKLVHIINGLGKGGAERLLVETLPLLKKVGLEVEIVQITNRNAVPEYIARLEAAGIVVHTLSNRNIYNPLNILSLKQFLKTRIFDVIHVHIFPAMYWTSLALLFRNSGKVKIFTEHSTQNRRWGKMHFKLMDKCIYKKYDSIVAITEDVKNSLKNWQPTISNRIEVIHNGINIATIKDVEKQERYHLLSGLRIDREDVILLMMTARFDNPKDFKTPLKALALLPPNYILLLAGEGPQKREMESFASQIGIADRIIFLGFRNDVLSLMKSVDINILSSRYEGLSGVTLEALCAGRPFLGSDVSGINNVVPDNRFLFNAGNEKNLADKITQIIASGQLQKTMIEDCVEYVKEWDISIMIQKHLDLYNRLLKGKLN
jgi:glycosyltransferase involved in cell wall biosynthesis